MSLEAYGILNYRKQKKIGKNDVNQVWPGQVAKLDRIGLGKKLDQIGSAENS